MSANFLEGAAAFGEGAVGGYTSERGRKDQLRAQAQEAVEKSAARKEAQRQFDTKTKQQEAALALQLREQLSPAARKVYGMVEDAFDLGEVQANTGYTVKPGTPLTPETSRMLESGSKSVRQSQKHKERMEYFKEYEKFQMAKQRLQNAPIEARNEANALKTQIQLFDESIENGTFRELGFVRRWLMDQGWMAEPEDLTVQEARILRGQMLDRMNLYSKWAQGVSTAPGTPPEKARATQKAGAAGPVVPSTQPAGGAAQGPSLADEINKILNPENK